MELFYQEAEPYQWGVYLLCLMVGAATYIHRSRLESGWPLAWSIGTLFFPAIALSAYSPAASYETTHLRSLGILFLKLFLGAVLVTLALTILGDYLSGQLWLSELFVSSMKLWFSDKYSIYVEGIFIDFGDKVISFQASFSRTASLVALGITLCMFFRADLFRNSVILLISTLLIGIAVEYLTFMLRFIDVADLTKHELKEYVEPAYAGVFLAAALSIYLVGFLLAFLSYRKLSRYGA